MVKKLEPIHFKVYDPVFHQEVVVFCNCAEKDLFAWQKRLGVPDSHNEGVNPNYHAFSTQVDSEDEPTIYLIWLNRFDWTLDDQDTLIHEVIHTIVRLWKTSNISFVPETQEFFAHSVGGLYRLIAEKILIRKKKPRGQTKTRKSVSAEGQG